MIFKKKKRKKYKIFKKEKYNDNPGNENTQNCVDLPGAWQSCSPRPAMRPVQRQRRMPPSRAGSCAKHGGLRNTARTSRTRYCHLGIKPLPVGATLLLVLLRRAIREIKIIRAGSLRLGRSRQIRTWILRLEPLV